MAGWEHHNAEPLGAPDAYDNVVESVRFGEVALSEDGQMGAMSNAGVIVDDPDRSLDFGGWSRWYLLETGARANAAIGGTVSKVAHSLDVTGAGTAFLTDLSPGDEIKIPGGGGTEYLVVRTIADDTHLTLFSRAAHTAAGQACTRAGLQHTWHGIVGVQGIDRGDDRADGGEYGDGRDWSLDLIELNGILHSRLGHTAAYNRKKEETPAARLAFLLATTEFADLGIVDEGLVDYPTTPLLDPDDLRGRPLDEVLNGICTVVKRTFAVRYHELTGQRQLILKSPTAFYLPTNVIISNDLADRGVPGIWIADRRGKLTRDPTKVADGLYGTGSKYKAYETRPATTTAFGHRDDSAPNATIKKLAKLQAYLQADLAECSTQDEHGHIKVEAVPAAEVNKVGKLSAVQVKMTHWTGDWATGRWARVLRREIHDYAPGFYSLDLDVGPCTSPIPVRSVIQTVTERHQDSLDFKDGDGNPVNTTVGHLLLYRCTWRQMLTEPQPPLEEAWTEIGRASFVDDHDAPDPCMVVTYATIVTVPRASYTKQAATGGSSNGTIVHSVMTEVKGVAIADLQVLTSGPNAPATDFDIGSIGDCTLAWGVWGDGWDGFFVDPTGIETATFAAGWTLEFHSSRDYDATTLAAFVAGFPNAVYAHVVDGAAIEAQVGMVNSAGTPSHWGGVVVWVA